MNPGDWYHPDRVAREGEWNESRALFARWRASQLGSATVLDTGRLADRVEPPTRDLIKLMVLSVAADLEAAVSVPHAVTLSELIARMGLTLDEYTDTDPFADIRCVWPTCRTILTSSDKNGACRKHSPTEPA